MAIKVVPGSAQLPVTKKPVPGIGKDASNTNMEFTCVELLGEKLVFIEVERPIEMRGRCKITGDPGDNPAGWTLGLIQLQWIETNWGYYQGEKDIHGSSFLQRGRPRQAGPRLPRYGRRRRNSGRQQSGPRSHRGDGRDTISDQHDRDLFRRSP